jgi:glycosyltransferase involved in cell wall biosynthesis
MDVSVIVPALNAQSTIARAVESALNQTLQTIEVIVVDDGSDDQTAMIVAELGRKDPRARLLRHAKRQGVPAACNEAIANAGGEWIRGT